MSVYANETTGLLGATTEQIPQDQVLAPIDRSQTASTRVLPPTTAIGLSDLYLEHVASPVVQSETVAVTEPRSVRFHQQAYGPGEWLLSDSRVWPRDHTIQRFANALNRLATGEFGTPATRESVESAKSLLPLLVSSAGVPQLASDEDGAVLFVWEDPEPRRTMILTIEAQTLHLLVSSSDGSHEFIDDVEFRGDVPSNLLTILKRFPQT